MKNNKQGVLLKNTVMLYLLTFSGYFFSFITVPYQTRLLGAVLYGEVGFAQSITVYFRLFLDFGFILASTEDVARNKHDPRELSRITTAVLLCKLALGAVSFTVITGMCLAIERFRAYTLLHQLFFLSTFLNSLLPDFLYRGIEKMSALTYRAVAVQAFFTAAIFVLMRSASDFYMIPLLSSLGALGACAWSYWDVYKNLGIKFTRVSPAYIWRTMKRASGYFVSRIASTVYSATNTVVMGFLFPGTATLGYYTSAEKLMTTARSAFSPIADSLYPYMVNNRDYKLVKKIMLVLMPLIILGCTGVGIFAEEFCVLFLGAEYAGAGLLLQLLMPAVVLALPTYVFGFPMLSPMGLAKYANLSVVIGAVWHALVLVSLFFLGMLNAQSICIATSVIEGLVFGIRVWAVLCKRKREE